MFTLSAEEEKALEEMFDEAYQLKSFYEWVEMMEHDYGDIENPLIYIFSSHDRAIHYPPF